MGIVLHGNYQSLLDHLGTGKDWDLSRKRGGLKILPPFAYKREWGEEAFRGKMEALAGVRSYLDTIRQDYAAAGAPAPELVFGWEQGPGRRKPSPWPLQQIMARWQLAPDQLLMVDDLKPGWEMARACGVPFAAAGWGVLCDAARRDLQARADWYLERVEQLEDLLYRRT